MEEEMPPTSGSLANTMYKTAGTPPKPDTLPPALGAPVPTKPIIYRDEHIIYNFAHTGGDYAQAPNAMNIALHTVAHTRKAVGGDTIYLPFYGDTICSTRLTNPPPVGYNFFYTDNLSGCRFFIDSITGTNDLIVYHANTTANTAGPNAWADMQTAAAGNTLDTMRTNARGDGPYAALNLQDVGSIDLPTYFRAPGIEERRKGTGLQGRGAPVLGAAAGRNRPEFVGGCFVCGFFINGQWEFWFQTWGDFGYTRPGYFQGIATLDWVGVHKRRTQGQEQLASIGNFRVMEFRQFF
jgi:hypothetical protein